MSRLTRRSLVAAGLATPFVARHGFAQSDWPKGPVRWVVAFAAGGAADTVARNIAVRASEILNQQVIIENRTGGNAVVAANFVLQAPRDGQTFLIDAANQVTNPHLIKDLPFDYPATWIPVTLMSSFPQVLAVKQDFPAKTIQEYLAAAKAKPGTISYGTPPAAGMGQMAGEELQRRAEIKLIHVPYRGTGPALNDLAAGIVDAYFGDPATLGLIRGGKARAMAVTSPTRWPVLPETPAATVERIADLARVALRESAVTEGLAKLGFEPFFLPSGDYGRLLAKEREQWGPIVKASGFSSDD